MNKLDFLKKINDILYHNLLCYSTNYLMNEPKKEYAKQWEDTQEKIGLIEEIIEDVKQTNKEDITYLVRNDEFDVLGRFIKLNEAVVFSEKKKREYMAEDNESNIWIEVEGESERVYVALGGEKNPINNEEEAEFE